MQPAFDRIVLKTGETVNVQPLRFPGGSRTVPNPFPAGGDLQIRPLNLEVAAAEVSVPWTAVQRIDLFEDMIMREALALAEQKKFDEAFPYFSHLLNKAPHTRGLDQAINSYLQANALAAYNGGEYDRSLAILGSLYDRTPNASGLSGAVDTVAGKIIEKYLAERNFKSARTTLDVVEQTFNGLRLTVVQRWRQRFLQAATSQLAEAEKLLNAKKYLAARQAVNQAVGVWPELNGVNELRARLQQEYPVVTLGVLQRSPQDPQYRIDSSASVRAASLTNPTILELRGYTAEGGEYQSNIAQVELAPSGLELNFELLESQSSAPLDVSLAASALARQLLEAANLASGHGSELLAELVERVDVEYPQNVRVHFRHPHVRPESLLTLPMGSELVGLSDRGAFGIEEYNDELIRFATSPAHRGAIAEIHERAFPDDDQLITALSQGVVDVVDRVPPWQIRQLQADDSLVVESYLLPTVHVLVPTGRSPLTEQREFRRALCYGIRRDRFVHDVLLAGQEVSGFQTVSGPFPAGVSLSDPIRYGYNSQVKPRPYDPYMAIVLSTAAWSNVQKAKGVKEPGDTPLPTVTLGHSADAVARMACTEIAKDLNSLGIPIELVELTTEQMLEAEKYVDLKYAELSTWEPVSDARRLLGAGGIVTGTSDFMRLALDRLDAARNWNDVRGRLYQIHDAASTDLPVIPLWQTVNYFAYRRELSGISEQPVHLFQDLSNWQLEFQANRL
ncbi:ABC transporter substrate-binding protein [Aeoliella sp. ICT_H6.2]|uniref:ABC transporter substrate-binding protein n=1 Tax=Aeoliella straminimaris TaxID=2954799 RepID=A0A9X2FE71_9BACT|nr:ABC transporter substrate-binding protein [Aeoliella straminimaris]MCO6044704.1 ABC transporter substrate-binding protein [Aeoliella straminimaris]